MNLHGFGFIHAERNRAFGICEWRLTYRQFRMLAATGKQYIGAFGHFRRRADFAEYRLLFGGTGAG
jgi:hypothetical protein